MDTGKIGPAPGEAIVPAPFQVANGPVIRFQRSSSFVHAKLKLCSNTVPVQFQLRSRRAGETGSPFLHHLAVSIWPSLGIKRDENDAQRLWHDAAMQKTHFSLRFDRKLLKLNLAILGYFCALL